MKKSIFAVSAATLLFSLFALARGADAPTWKYFPIDSTSPTEGSYSGLIFNFENPAAATATVGVSLEVDGQHLDLKAEVETDRVHNEGAGYVHFAMKKRDTLKVLKVTIVMGEYSGIYDAPAPGQSYQLALSRKKGARATIGERRIDINLD